MRWTGCFPSRASLHVRYRRDRNRVVNRAELPPAANSSVSVEAWVWRIVLGAEAAAEGGGFGAATAALAGEWRVGGSTVCSSGSGVTGSAGICKTAPGFST